MNKEIREDHFYREEGWCVAECIRGNYITYEVQHLDELGTLRSDEDAVPLAEARGYKVDYNGYYIVTNMDDLPIATPKYYASVRITESSNLGDAVEQVLDSDFSEEHPLCDIVKELNKDIFILSLQELNDLVETIIKQKFWYMVNIGTKTTQELIIENLNK